MPKPLCASCEEDPAVLSHLWRSDAWHGEPLCAMCQQHVLDDPDGPRLVGDPETEHDDDEEEPAMSDTHTPQRYRVGCRACDDIFPLTSPIAPTPALLAQVPCPWCGTVGAVGLYPHVGSWPSDYNEEDDDA